MDIKSIGFAVAPDNIPAFLLDWELTKKCNLDCSYCDTGVEGGHDNTTDHPGLSECLASIDFMYEYVSMYMRQKKPTQRKVVLNVYGGESLFHPNIIEILKACKEKYTSYADQWHLTITTTTNAVINKHIWHQIIPLIDEFTVSYHAENLPKHEQLFFDNLLELKQRKCRVKCVIVMHNQPDMWDKCQDAIKFCEFNGIRYIAKALDGSEEQYTNQQFNQLKTFWISTTNTKNLTETKQRLDQVGNSELVTSTCEGRACCGGRKLSLNNELTSSVTFVPRQGFRDWYCSVNWFFLFVQQYTGNVYTNKDCRTTMNSQIGPLGNLSDTKLMLSDLQNLLDTKSMPVIKCVKSICLCGFCAPKAENIEEFKQLIQRNVVTDVINWGLI